MMVEDVHFYYAYKDWFPFMQFMYIFGVLSL